MWKFNENMGYHNLQLPYSHHQNWPPCASTAATMSSHGGLLDAPPLPSLLAARLAIYALGQPQRTIVSQLRF